MLNRTINLNTSVSILNRIVDKYGSGYEGKRVGEISINVELNDDSKKELGYLIFDEDDLDTYIQAHSMKNGEVLDITKLWKMIEEKYERTVIYVPEEREFSVVK